MTILGTIFLVIGSFFIAVAGLGLVRMKDTLLRMQAASKAATMGVACMGLGTFGIYPTGDVLVRVLVLVLLLCATTPIATHAIGGVIMRQIKPTKAIPASK